MFPSYLFIIAHIWIIRIRLSRGFGRPIAWQTSTRKWRSQLPLVKISGYTYDGSNLFIALLGHKARISCQQPRGCIWKWQTPNIYCLILMLAMLHIWIAIGWHTLFFQALLSVIHWSSTSVESQAALNSAAATIWMCAQFCWRFFSELSIFL